MKIHNFSAGPSILPREVFEKSAEAVLDYNKSGLSILEISHRSDAFIDIISTARKLVLELLQLENKGYEVLFLQGGASMQFLMVPYNLMPQNGRAAYLDSGSWASNAIKEAQLFGTTHIIASSKTQNYSFIPKNYEIPPDASYFHCTSNNTIFGTQMRTFPTSPIPIVCDMSSDIFSRDIDYSQFDLIYAGAQKNSGPAGTTLVIIKSEMLQNSTRTIPSILDYRQHIARESMYNTPPVFAVYASLLTLQWLKAQGGIKAISQRNKAKAKFLYDEIDRNSMFRGTAAVEDRSQMNVTFVLTDESHAKRFETLCDSAGISGIKGHRSVGGYRASIYNAMPIESVEALVSVMIAFEHDTIEKA